MGKKTRKKQQPVALNPRVVHDWAYDAVMHAAETGSELAGPERGRLARQHLAEKLDGFVQFGDGPIGKIAEDLDGPVALFLASLVQGAFERLRRRGQL